MPKLSIAAKLYTIFALLAAGTGAFAAVAVIDSRQQDAMIGQVGSAFRGTLGVEKVNGLIYAVVMESRGIYMSPDAAAARRYGDALLAFNDRIAQVVAEWRKDVGADEAQRFEEFAGRIRQFIDFRRELARLG